MWKGKYTMQAINSAFPDALISPFWTSDNAASVNVVECWWAISFGYGWDHARLSSGAKSQRCATRLYWNLTTQSVQKSGWHPYH